MSKYRTTMSELMKKVYKEDGHQDVSSSKRMCRTIVEDAQQIEAKLNSMSPEDSLDTWWTNKLAVSANNLNKARDYIVNDIKEETEIEEISDKLKLKVLARKIQNMKDKAFKKTMSTIKSPLFADNEIEEGRMKDIFTADQEGKSAEEIAKLMKLPLKTVKSILGEATIKPYVSMQRDKATGKMNYVVLDKDEKEAFRSTNQIVAQDYFKKNYNKLKEENLDEFTTDQIKLLKKSYGGMRGKTIAPQKANMLSKHLDRLDLLSLRQLVKEKIPFLSTLARNKIYRKTGKFEEIEEQSSSDIMKKAKEFGVTAKMTPKGIDISGFKSQDGMDKFMKYVASQGKNMINLAKVGMKRNFEELEETPQGYALVQKAKEIAKKMANNYSGAVKEIEKLQKGLSDNSSVKDALMKANESLEEKIQPFMISYSKNGQHAGFESGNSLSDIQNKAQKLRAKGFTIDKMGRYSPPVGDMFMKKFARKEEYIKEEEMPKEEPKKEKDKKAEEENKDTQIRRLIDQIAILKTKLENEKNKAVKPEPNPDTGEVPLTVGVAYKHFKDKKEKEVKEETISERGGANTSSKQGSFAKSRKPKYRFGYRVAEKQPKGDDIEEATVVSDISGISIPALKRETAKFNIKVARVTPGGPMGAEYEVTFTGAEKDLIAYAKEHFGFDDKPGTFQQLKKHLNMDYVPEKAMSDKEKRLQRAKDMIKYYDAQKKAALKGKNKELAKKMLKNEADLSKKQIKMVHKVADDLPKKDFKDRYGKEKGDAVRFGTATNMVKKKLGMKESKEQKLRNMKTVIDMLDGTHGRIIASKSDLQKLMNLTKKMNKLENPRGPSSSEKRDYENLVKKYSNRLGSKRNEYLGYLKDIMKEQTINEDRRLYVETIAGLKKKAEKSGMPYGILKKVYDRGMAAWKSGHRPGASQQQWAFARVNSFVTKSSGTWGGADKDLAKQVRGSK